MSKSVVVLCFYHTHDSSSNVLNTFMTTIGVLFKEALFLESWFGLANDLTQTKRPSPSEPQWFGSKPVRHQIEAPSGSGGLHIGFCIEDPKRFLLRHLFFSED